MEKPRGLCCCPRGFSCFNSRRRATLPRRADAVPSPQQGLTSVFGMGTGVTPALWPPGNPVNVSKKAFGCRL